MADYKVLKNIVGSELNYGDTVFLNESGSLVPYILVQPGTGRNYLFLRKYAYNEKVAFFAEAADLGTSDTDRIYANRTLDNYLSTTFRNRFSDSFKNVFVENGISVTGISGDSSYGYSIHREIFAPSATELGVGQQSNGTVPLESPFGAYKYFSINAKEKRRCKLTNENGSYVEYWTRSKNNHAGNTFNYYAITIDSSGDYDTASWQKNSFYVRPVVSIDERVTIYEQDSLGWRILPNLPPSEPVVEIKKGTVCSGTVINFNVTAKDNDGPGTIKFEVQSKKDDSETWNDELITENTSFQKTILYKEAEYKIELRVRGVDNYNNASDWVSLAELDVVNNMPPSKPGSVSIVGNYKNEPISVVWGESTDEDDNISGYYIYRSVNGGSFAHVGTSQTNYYRDAAGDWDSVRYQIQAYDAAGESSEVTTSQTVTLKSRVTMSLLVHSSSAIYEGAQITCSSSSFNETPKELWYTISDTGSGKSYTVIVSLDGSVLFTQKSNSTGNLAFTITKDMWHRITNGSHEIVAVCRDSDGNEVVNTIHFEKMTKVVSLTLKNPIVVESDSVVDKLLLNIAGSFPSGITLTVQVTNNANDGTSTKWQTLTSAQINSNEFITFNNKTATNGSAFNFKITANRNSVTDECFINSISGMFGRDVFEYIFERLDALEGA